MTLYQVNATNRAQTLYNLMSMMTRMSSDLSGQKVAGTSGSKGWNS